MKVEGINSIPLEESSSSLSEEVNEGSTLDVSFERTIMIDEWSSEEPSSNEKDGKASSSRIFGEVLSSRIFEETSSSIIFERRNNEEDLSRRSFERSERTFIDSSHEKDITSMDSCKYFLNNIPRQ